MNEKPTYEKLLADNKEMSKDLFWRIQNDKTWGFVQSLICCVTILLLWSITLMFAIVGANTVIEVSNFSPFGIACLQLFFNTVTWIMPLYIFWHFITVFRYTHEGELISWYEKLKAKWNALKLERAKEFTKKSEQKSFDPPA